MKRSALLFIGTLFILPSCEQEKEVAVTETRRVTLMDEAPKLHASSRERFLGAPISPVKATTPEGWQEAPSTQFRLLNYRFGKDNEGEVWVSVSGGELLENINRWLRQFDLDPIDAATLKDWNKVQLGSDAEGYWVEAEGTYAGMGGASKENHALAGIIATADGGVLTVKMVGPIDEVEAQKQTLKDFAKSIKWDAN